MIIQPEDVLNAMLNVELANTKASFAKRSELYTAKIMKVLAALRPVIDLRADEKSLREAKVLVDQMWIESLFPVEGSAFVKTGKEAISSLVRNVSDEVAEKRKAPMTLENIVALYNLSPKAAEAYSLGASIGELFLLQPSLYM